MTLVKYLNLMMIKVCGTVSAINLNAQSTIKVVIYGSAAYMWCLVANV